MIFYKTTFILDDADFPAQKSDALKSFCDPSGEDNKCFACWNAASVQQYQPRFLCANIFDRGAEPPSSSGKSVLTRSEFMKLLGDCSTQRCRPKM
eukprot:1459772-Amphidinium_carterae.1